MCTSMKIMTLIIWQCFSIEVRFHAQNRVIKPLNFKDCCSATIDNFRSGHYTCRPQDVRG